MTTKQVRWRCPLCQTGVLAPSRPRRLDVRRWCLDCSAKGTRLVERVPVALEAKRKERKRAAARKAAEKRGFVRPDDYYRIAGWDVRKLVSFIPDKLIRVRSTKGPGPVKVSSEAVTFRTGPWVDTHAAKAQSMIADGRWNLFHQPVKDKHQALFELRKTVRAWLPPEVYLSWRPRSLARLEIELADLLRKNAAVKLLTDSSEIMERTG